MTDTFANVGDFALDANTRTVRGLLVKWGEQTRPEHAKPTVFERGALTVPADFSHLLVNRHHDKHDPVGRFTDLEDTDEGLVATFALARTPEGDEVLRDAKPGGPLRKLSPEVRGARPTGLDASAALTGAAFVTENAFASSAVFALEEIAPGAPAEVTEFTPDAEGVIAIVATAVPESVTVTAEDTTTNYTKEAEVAEVIAPETTAEKRDLSASSVFNLIAKGQKGVLTPDESADFALSDIKITGTGALPVAGVIQPAWLGELYGKRSYARKYFPLVRQGTITAMEEKGFAVLGTEDLVKTWVGNKVELPSGSGSTELRTSVLAKWGYAADIAQEFFLIPGNEEVIEAFLNKIVNSYERVTDVWLAGQIAALANTNNVAAATYPSGYPAALGALIQGIEAVEDAGHTPTFVIANPTAWSQLLYTPKDQIPEFIKFGFGVQGEGTADGIRVVKGNLTGANLKPTSVVVGTSAAVHVNELAGASPVQLSALDIARGGVDKAVIGMTQFMADDPSGVIAVTPAA